jgi:hypothetical protein
MTAVYCHSKITQSELGLFVLKVSNPSVVQQRISDRFRKRTPVMCSNCLALSNRSHQRWTGSHGNVIRIFDIGIYLQRKRRRGNMPEIPATNAVNKSKTEKLAYITGRDVASLVVIRRLEPKSHVLPRSPDFTRPLQFGRSQHKSLEVTDGDVSQGIARPFARLGSRGHGLAFWDALTSPAE